MKYKIMSIYRSSRSIQTAQSQLNFMRFAEAHTYIALVIATVQYSEGTVTKKTKWPMTRDEFDSYLAKSKDAILKYCEEHEGDPQTSVAGPTGLMTAQNVEVGPSFDGTRSPSLAERMNSYISAYDGITVIASLVFSFAVSLAAGQSKEDSFTYQSTMCLFHVLITLCIGCLLHCVLVFSLINYNANRFIGSGIVEKSASFVEKTFNYRNHARISFCGGLFFFVAALCVLFFDGLPIWLAIVNTVIMLVFVCVVVVSSKNISAR